MKILLIQPCYPYPRHMYKDFVKGPPLGLAYIAAVLEREGFPVEIIDMFASDRRSEEVSEIVKKCNPDIVGISCNMTFTQPEVIKIARKIKETNKEIPVIVGGNHATFTFESLMKSCCEIDYVVRFEGELTMLNLIKCISASEKVQGCRGIVYRSESGEIGVTPDRPRIDNLDSLPFPARHLLPMTIYSAAERGAMITTRGCPYGCVFCSTSLFHGRKIRAHGVIRVVDEMELLLHEYKVKGILFTDDLFTYSRERTIQICNEMKERGLNTVWGCSARVDSVDPELLRIMHDAGCIGIFYGIESVTQEVLNSIRKGFKLEKAYQAVKWAKENGIKVTAAFIIGLPGEDAKSIKNIDEFLRKTCPDDVRFSMLSTYPGTELYLNPEKYGIRFLKKDWSSYDQIHPIIETGTMSREQILKAYVKLVRTYYEDIKRDFMIF